MEYRTLGNTGLSVSVLGFGVSPVGNVFNEIPEEQGIAAIHKGIDLGINYFDVAPFYGDTLAELRLGKALKNKRQNIFLATKGGRYFTHFDFSYQKIVNSIDESLKRLQTDYVDVYQLHDIEFVTEKQLLEEAVPALLEVKKSGKARFVGITGLPVRYLAKIARMVEVDTVLSWAHYNLVEDEINDELVPLSIQKGFGLINAAPFLQHLLTDVPLPGWHRSPDEVKAIQPVLVDVCRKYGLDLSDVALQYAVNHPHITTTIAGMNDPAIVAKNAAALRVDVPEQLWKEIEIITAPVKNRMWFEGEPANNISK